jgi:hypothetical protein
LENQDLMLISLEGWKIVIDSGLTGSVPRGVLIAENTRVLKNRLIIF